MGYSCGYNDLAMRKGNCLRPMSLLEEGNCCCTPPIKTEGNGGVSFSLQVSSLVSNRYLECMVLGSIDGTSWNMLEGVVTINSIGSFVIDRYKLPPYLKLLQVLGGGSGSITYAVYVTWLGLNHYTAPIVSWENEILTRGCEETFFIKTVAGGNVDWVVSFEPSGPEFSDSVVANALGEVDGAVLIPNDADSGIVEASIDDMNNFCTAPCE